MKVERKLIDQPQRLANRHDRPCDDCGVPMIGIMRASEYGGYKPPRRICVECESWDEKDVA